MQFLRAMVVIFYVTIFGASYVVSQPGFHWQGNVHAITLIPPPCREQQYVQAGWAPAHPVVHMEYAGFAGGHPPPFTSPPATPMTPMTPVTPHHAFPMPQYDLSNHYNRYTHTHVAYWSITWCPPLVNIVFDDAQLINWWVWLVYLLVKFCL